MLGNNNQYMDILNIQNEDEVLSKIKQLASDLTDHEHLIRSCILDLHAAVEVELKRIFFWNFQPLLFFTDDKEANQRIKNDFDKMISGLGFMNMWRVLKPIMVPWYPDFCNIDQLNTTRNQAAHRDIKKIQYKNRSPFDDADCLCQMYFDVWSIKQRIPKFFDHMMMPYYRNREYYKQYGDISVSPEVIDEIGSWYDSQ